MQPRSIKQTYLRYLWPTLATMVLYSTYTMADGIFVGHGVNHLALAGVNIAMPYIALLFAVSMLISIGSSNLITHALGQKDTHQANQIFSLGLFLGIFVGLMGTLLSLWKLDDLVRWLGAVDAIQVYVKDYLRIIISFSSFFILTYIFEIMVKADGKPHLAIRFMILSAVTNILLDYVFIFLFSWGIKGAALATGIAQALPCFGYLFHFLSKKAKLHLKPFAIQWSLLKDIILFGLPASLTELSTGFIILAFNQTVGHFYQEEGLASFSVLAYLLTLVVNTMLAINQSSQPLMSFYYGAKRPANIRQLKIYSLITVACASLLIVSLMQLFPGTIFAIFFHDMDPLHLAEATKALRLFSPAFGILGFNIILGGYLTAIQEAKLELVIALLRGYVMISLCLFGVMLSNQGPWVWPCLALSEGLTLIISILLSRKGDKKLTQGHPS